MVGRADTSRRDACREVPAGAPQSGACGDFALVRRGSSAVVRLPSGLCSSMPHSSGSHSLSRTGFHRLTASTQPLCFQVCASLFFLRVGHVWDGDKISFYRSSAMFTNCAVVRHQSPFAPEANSRRAHTQNGTSSPVGGSADCVTATGGI